MQFERGTCLLDGRHPNLLTGLAPKGTMSTSDGGGRGSLEMADELGTWVVDLDGPPFIVNGRLAWEASFACADVRVSLAGAFPYSMGKWAVLAQIAAAASFSAKIAHSLQRYCPRCVKPLVIAT